MQTVYVVGAGMTRFDKHLNRSIRHLTATALERTLADARLKKRDIQASWFANSMWGHFDGQHCIRGQIALRNAGIEGIPIYNEENACAGGATAFHAAWMGVASGLYDCVLAIGSEKLYHADKAKSFQAFLSGIDVENADELMAQMKSLTDTIDLRAPVPDDGAAGENRSAFMDIYSLAARLHMAEYGTTQRQLAVIASKNHYHSSMNPYAQFQKPMSVEQILSTRVVSWPLTVPMCAPIGDGAAAAILCSEDYLRFVPEARPVKIRASVLGSGTNRSRLQENLDIAVRLSRRAYEIAGVGPEDIDLAEVHDATAFGELHQTEALGFCPIGRGGWLAQSGATRLGGEIPINTSGGLESRGHPIGASGLGQINELISQLRYEAGDRQVENCRLALAENGGGNLGHEEAAMGIHILERVA